MVKTCRRYKIGNGMRTQFRFSFNFDVCKPQFQQIKTEFFSSKKQCNFLLQIQWNINPEIFRIGGFALRYYSIMFALTFYSSYLVLSKTYIKENVSISLLNKLTIFVFIGTLAGAR